MSAVQPPGQPSPYRQSWIISDSRGYGDLSRKGDQAIHRTSLLASCRITGLIGYEGPREGQRTYAHASCRTAADPGRLMLVGDQARLSREHSAHHRPLGQFLTFSHEVTHCYEVATFYFPFLRQSFHELFTHGLLRCDMDYKTKGCRRT